MVETHVGASDETCFWFLEAIPHFWFTTLDSYLVDFIFPKHLPLSSFYPKPMILSALVHPCELLSLAVSQITTYVWQKTEHVLSHSFCELGVRGWLSWVICLRVPHETAIRVVAMTEVFSEGLTGEGSIVKLSQAMGRIQLLMSCWMEGLNWCHRLLRLP